MFQAVQARLDSLLDASRTPGLQYLVVNADQTVFEYAGGWADLARRQPMCATTTMMAYSMSKTVTAAAVLQLIESQKLNLGDPICRFFDSWPYGPDVTIRHLLAHTAGIPNPIPLAWVHAPAPHDSFDEHGALAAVLRRHGRLSFSPGTRYGYSNIGYWLLGEFVERVSGVAFTAYVSSHVLQRLGIPPQQLGYAIPGLANHAHGYLEKYSLLNLVKRLMVDREFIGSYHDRWLEIYPHYVNGAAFGGLVGTTLGFAKFLQDQLQPHSLLFNDLSRSQFYAAQQTSGGAPAGTSLGWHLGTLDGVRHYYKEGGGGGFHCMMRLYPAREIGTVLMTNATCLDVGGLLNTLDPEFLLPARQG